MLFQDNFFILLLFLSLLTFPVFRFTDHVASRHQLSYDVLLWCLWFHSACTH